VRVLVLNAGSSSLKYQLYAMPEERVLASGIVERIGEVVPDHAAALGQVLSALCGGAGAPLASLAEIGAVGHRVVHGGEHFAQTVRITPEVEAAIAACVPLAPLHNPPNLLGIRVAREALPGVPQVAVFDTAFHQTLPPRAWLYALPRALYTEHRIRRYGFHGTSHRYVAGRAAELLGHGLEALNLITCHLGNGASLCAIAGGRSVDTSMGLTPLEGVAMGTRSGDLDPAIPLFLQRSLGMSVDEVDRLLNKQSGLLGLSGRSNDLRVIEQTAAGGDAAAAQALDVYCYRIKKAIGAYTAVLGRVDALVFTAGVGENSARVRAGALSGLEPLGFALDPVLNLEVHGREADITGPGSRACILVIPTDEELMIARDTYEIAQA